MQRLKRLSYRGLVHYLNRRVASFSTGASFQDKTDLQATFETQTNSNLVLNDGRVYGDCVTAVEVLV